MRIPRAGSAGGTCNRDRAPGTHVIRRACLAVTHRLPPCVYIQIVHGTVSEYGAASWTEGVDRACDWRRCAVLAVRAGGALSALRL